MVIHLFIISIVINGLKYLGVRGHRPLQHENTRKNTDGSLINFQSRALGEDILDVNELDDDPRSPLLVNRLV